MTCSLEGFVPASCQSPNGRESIHGGAARLPSQIATITFLKGRRPLPKIAPTRETHAKWPSQTRVHGQQQLLQRLYSVFSLAILPGSPAWAPLAAPGYVAELWAGSQNISNYRRTAECPQNGQTFVNFALSASYREWGLERPHESSRYLYLANTNV